MCFRSLLDDSSGINPAFTSHRQLFNLSVVHDNARYRWASLKTCQSLMPTQEFWAFTTFWSTGFVIPKAVLVVFPLEIPRVALPSIFMFSHHHHHLLRASKGASCGIQSIAVFSIMMSITRKKKNTVLVAHLLSFVSPLPTPGCPSQTANFSHVVSIKMHHAGKEEKFKPSHSPSFSLFSPFLYPPASSVTPS